LQKVVASIYGNNAEYIRRAEQTLRDIGIAEMVFFDFASPGLLEQSRALRI
jgi:hypothetical protein